MKTRRVVIHRSGKTKALHAYCSCQSHLAKNLQNTANFYIRNLRSGLKKDPTDRTANENEVVRITMESIDRYNGHKQEQFASAVRRARKLAARGNSMAAAALVRRYLLNLDTCMNYPDADHWMLSYEQLNAVMQWSKNRDYYALPSQVNQQILRKVIKSWKGYFTALKDYRKFPGKYLGEPKAPKYKRTPYATVHYTNQIIKPTVSGGKKFLTFPGTGLKLCIGRDMDCPGIVKVEVKPVNGDFEVLVTYASETQEPKIPEHPERILGLDFGVDNFLAGITNFPAVPFLAAGNWIKSENRYFNKKRARLISKLTRGMDSTKSVKNSRRLDAISKKRERKFRDFFYKLAYWVLRYCMENKVDVVVIGHNQDWKQGMNLGTVNNQNFVQIPYMTFAGILKQVCAAFGIPVILREESYTSKASLVDGDVIPTFQENDDTKHVFSGRRISRGQYRTKDGVVIHADLNGAGNIIRKEYPEAFSGVADWSYLNTSVCVVTREELCRGTTQGRCAAKPAPRKHRSCNRRHRHERHWDQKLQYMELFGCGKDKTAYKKQPQNTAA